MLSQCIDDSDNIQLSDPGQFYSSHCSLLNHELHCIFDLNDKSNWILKILGQTEVFDVLFFFNFK